MILPYQYHSGSSVWCMQGWWNIHSPRMGDHHNPPRWTITQENFLVTILRGQTRDMKKSFQSRLTGLRTLWIIEHKNKCFLALLNKPWYFYLTFYSLIVIFINKALATEHPCNSEAIHWGIGTLRFTGCDRHFTIYNI